MAAPAASSSSAATSSGAGGASKTLESLHFDNLALRVLPIDPEKKNYTREVPNACFSLVEPTKVADPKLVCYSPDVLRWIELNENEVNRPDFAEYFSGNKILPGARPAAHCYCGHQFGHFSGQLGDGATMYLGEIVTSKNERIEIQFKGAGQTPYSRRADGRKVLRSSIREFLCSEANHYLGIPTTRAGTIVTSSTKVERDIFYNGNSIYERATIITRLAHSFIRFGSFEIAKPTDSITGRTGPSVGNKQIIKTLLDYVVNTFYADAVAKAENEEERYLAFFRELTRRTAVMVARWQTVGWCHGVLNTDNMSILGITIDYGPFGYMESFDPEYICNGSDNEGRYRYEAQPEICGWNLLKFSQNIEHLVPRAKLRAIVGEFQGHYEAEYMRINRNKLGVGLYEKKEGMEEQKSATPAAAASSSSATAESNEDDSSPHTSLITSFYSTMASTGSDFTNSWRALGKYDPRSQESLDAVLAELVSHCATLETKIAALSPRIPPAQMLMIMQMMQRQPGVFQRPGMEDQLQMIQQEIERTKQREALAKQDPSVKANADREEWRTWIEAYGKVLREEMEVAQAQGVSADEVLSHRRRVQNSANPKYILRNWIAQEVIQAAESGDYQPMKECLERLRDPYDVEDRGEQQQAHAASSVSSVSAMEESSTHGTAHPSDKVIEPSQDADRHKPPAGTQCKLHWNKKRPEWANDLKVT